MKHIRCRNLAIAVAGILSVGAVQAQSVKAQPGAKAEAPIPAITDWSSRSVIYAKPKMPDEFARGAAGDAEMARLYRDPRYTAQLLRRIESELPVPASKGISRGKSTATAATATAKCDDRRRGHCTETPAPTDNAEGSVLRDWSNVLGGGTNGQGGRGMEGVFPAKYTFSITDAPSCSGDFVVYPTNAPGATQSGTRQEQWSGTIAGDFNAGETLVIGLPGPRQVVLTASSSVNSGRNFQTAGTNDARATNLRDAVNRWASQTGFLASGTGTTVTITSNTAGDVNDASVTDGLGNINLARTYPGNGATTPGQPTIIAFDQLYQGSCDGSWNMFGATKAPNVKWAYTTGNGYITETSPVLSYYDSGQQVAFLQRNGVTLQLVLLKWVNGNGTAATPVPLSSSTAADYQAARGGAAAAMHVITLNGTSNTGNTPTFSAPFVDYAGDILWVGDGNGRLHKFTGVFRGLPAEVVGDGFPSTVAAGMKLSPPVYDNGSVYIGSQSGAGTLGGRLHRIDASNGANRFNSVKLAISNSSGLRDSPIVTGFPAPTGSIYAFLFNDGTAGDVNTCDSAGANQNSCRVIARFPLGFADSAAPAERAYVGRGNNINSTLYSGAFSEGYYTNGTGFMYIVGGQAVDTFIPRLWRVPLTNGELGTSQIGPVLAEKTCDTFVNCGALDNAGNAPNPNTALWNWSPVTVAKRGDDEYIYFSMPSHGGQTGCAGACVYLFNTNDLRNGTSEAWQLSISNPWWEGDDGIATNENDGTITVNGVTLTANSDFSTSGNRAADRAEVIAAINRLTTFSAGEVGACESGGCFIRITSGTLSDLASNVVTTNSLGNTTLTNPVNGSAGSPVTWGASVNANTGLKAAGGTGGIVVDNNSGTTGASQIYFTQQAAGGNAIQASQSALD